ncbi:MAG: ATP-binding protein, partial [Pseudomonadota bacterium]
SATLLDVRCTTLLTALTIVAATMLTLWAMPPPLMNGEPPAMEIRKLGLWVAISVTLVFISLYVFRMARERRATQDALTAMQTALAREQRVSSLGALAAAVVHELGTPLSTIAVAAREMERGLDDGEPLKEDARLILDQAARCRDALRQLAERPQDQASGETAYAPIGALVEIAAQPYATEQIGIVYDRGPVDAEAGPEPLAIDRPEVRHAIAVYVENAVQFAASQVEIAVQWDAQEILVVIQDDGPGFAASVLDRLGEPYVSNRADTARRAAGHLGLGVFIAQTLLEGVGAQVQYSNADAGGQIQTDRGARIAIRWPRGVFERMLGV